MPEDIIKIAMIGCGGNARGHARRISQEPDCELVALVDPSAAAMGSLKEHVPAYANLPSYSDHQTMLAAVKPDAVEISTPHTLHFEHIMDSLNAGCDVLTEKPMVCTVDHANQVIAKVEETGKKLMISYQRHFMPPYMYCRDVVQSGELGPVHFVTAHQCQNWYRGTHGKWRQDPALSGGGQLNDSGSHLLDILLWILEASPAEVYAMMDYLESKVDILTAMSIKFDNNALCAIGVVGHAAGQMREDFTIWMEKGTLFIRDGKLYREESGTGMVEVAQEDLPEGNSPDRAFLDLLRGTAENRVGPENGLRVIQLTEAAWQSAEEDRPVKVDLS